MNLDTGVAQSMWRLGYGMDDLQIGVTFPAGKRIFIFPKASSLGLIPTQTVTELAMEIRQLD
jgi:hypothetical protein